MKATLLFAGALALMFAGGAIAKERAGAQAHYKAHKVVRPIRLRAAPAKDPYTAYWNDPSRAAPPFSYFGDVR